MITLMSWYVRSRIGVESLFMVEERVILLVLIASSSPFSTLVFAKRCDATGAPNSYLLTLEGEPTPQKKNPVPEALEM